MDERASRTIGHLAERWKSVDTGALYPAFALLAKGRPVSVAQIAAAGRLSPNRVEEAFRSDRVDVDATGRLVDLFGVSLGPSPHRVHFDEGRLFACCALVGTMIRFFLDRPIRVEASDPVTEEPQVVHVDLHGVTRMAPESAVAVMVETELEEVLKDAGTSFCRHVRLFSSSVSASQFVAQDERRYIVSVPDLHGQGRALFDAVWSDSP